MAFSVIQGLFSADASSYVNELEDAASASEEFAGSSAELSDDLEGIVSPSETAAGGIGDLGESAEGAAAPLGEASEELDAVGGAGTEANAQLDPLQGGFDGLSTSAVEAGDTVGGTTESFTGLDEATSGVDESLTGTGESLDSVGESGTQTADGLSTVGESAGQTQDSLSGVGESATAVSDQFDTIGGSAQEITTSVNDVGVAFDGVGESAGQAGDSLSGAGDSAATVSGQFDDIGVSAGDTATSVDDVGVAFDSAGGAADTADFDGVSGSMDDIDASSSGAAGGLDDVGGSAGDATFELDGVSGSAEEASDSLFTIEDAGFAAGAGMAAVGGAGLAVTEQTKDMRSDLNQTGVTMGMTGDEANEMARGISDATFPMEDAVGTMGSLASQGDLTQDELEDTALASDELADATGTTATSIADNAGPAIRAFGDDISDLSDHQDTFTWLTHETTMDVEEFSGAVERLAPEMQEMGMGLDDAAVYMAALEEEGITGRQAIQQFRQASNDAEGDQDEFQEALGLTDEQLQAQEDSLSEAEGATEEYAEEGNATLTVVDDLSAAYDDFLMSVGATGGQVETASTAMMGLGGGLMGLQSAGSMAMSAMTMMRGVTLASIPAWTAKAGAVLAATWPLLAIAGAAAAFGYAYQNNILGIGDMTDAVFGRVRSAIGTVMGVLGEEGLSGVVRVARETWDRAVGRMGQGVLSLRDRFVSGIASIRETLAGWGQWISGWGGRIRSAVVNAAQGAITGLRDRFNSGITGVQTRLQGFVGWVAGWGGRIRSTITNLAQQAIGGMRDRFNAGLAAVQSRLDGLSSWLTGWGGRIRSVITNTAQQAMSSLTNLISSGISSAQSVFAGLQSFLSGWGSQIVSIVTNAGNNAMSTLTSAINSGISTVQSALTGAMRFVGSWGRDLISTFTSAGRDAMSSLRSRISSGISRVTNAVSSLASSIMSYLPPGASGPLGNLTSRAARIPADIASGLRNALPDVRSAANSVAGAISDRLPLSPAKKGPLRTGPEERGEVIGSDLASGMSSQESAVGRAAEGLADTAADGMTVEEGELEFNVGQGNTDTMEAIRKNGNVIATEGGQTGIEEDLQTLVNRETGEAGAIVPEMEGRLRGAAREAGIDYLGDITDVTAGLVDSNEIDLVHDEMASKYSDALRSITEGELESRGRDTEGFTAESTRQAGNGSTPDAPSDDDPIQIVLELTDGLEEFVEATVSNRESVAIKKASNGTMSL